MILEWVSFGLYIFSVLNPKSLNNFSYSSLVFVFSRILKSKGFKVYECSILSEYLSNLLNCRYSPYLPYI